MDEKDDIRRREFEEIEENIKTRKFPRREKPMRDRKYIIILCECVRENRKLGYVVI